MEFDNTYKTLKNSSIMNKIRRNYNFEKAERRRKQIIHDIVMVSEPTYVILEKIIEHWNKNLEGIGLQTLINQVYCVPVLFPSEKEVGSYAKYLCRRGFVSQKKDLTFIPTHRGTDAYRRIHKGVLTPANCKLPDY